MRHAFLEAADHIEQHPEFFDFMVIGVPHDCGTPGCALGWVGFFGKLRARTHSEVADFIGTRTFDFYDRMDSYVGEKWTVNAALCAKGLRCYADEFHPAVNS